MFGLYSSVFEFLLSITLGATIIAAYLFVLGKKRREKVRKEYLASIEDMAFRAWLNGLVKKYSK